MSFIQSQVCVEGISQRPAASTACGIEPTADVVPPLPAKRDDARLRAMRSSLAVCVFLFAMPIRADEPNTLESFTFEGVALSAPVKDFKQKHPTASYVAANSEGANGLECYFLAPTLSSSGAIFSFLDGKLYSIEAFYDQERINKVGGTGMAVEKITAALGRPDDVKSNDINVVLIWNKPKREAKFLIGKSDLFLSVKNLEAESLLNDRRAKHTTLGF